MIFTRNEAKDLTPAAPESCFDEDLIRICVEIKR